jgi:hypothetical protein
MHAMKVSPSRPMTRRTLLAAVLPLCCAGCGDTPMANTPRLIREMFAKGDDLKITRDDVAKIPYACIAVRLGNGPQALLVLGRNDNAKLDWISAQREVVVTRRGRVVETLGLPEDLKQTEFLTVDPLGKPMAATAGGIECVRTIDLAPSGWAGVVVRTRFHEVGAAAIEILGSQIATHVWDEAGGAPRLDWQFTNRYWVDAQSGFVWKSLQQTAPGLPPLEIVVFRQALENPAPGGAGDPA